MMKALVMHIDMDAFYASIEQRDHEEYRGMPVIVGGLGGRGVVCTASYEARKFGVHSAMSTNEAKRRCPQGIFLDCNHPYYEAVSRDIFKIFHEFAPTVEPLSLDEAFLDVSGMELLVKDWRAYAMKLKTRIADEVGLIASVGIAPNKFLAKLASDLEKPNGLTVIEEQDIERILKDLPITSLWGVGKKTAEQLRALGFFKIGQVAKADVGFLVKQFGNLAYQLVNLANGRDQRRVEGDQLAQSIGNEITFAHDLVNEEQIAARFLALAEKVGGRLRQEGVTARTISIKIRYATFQTLTRSLTLIEPTNFDEDLYHTALLLYKKCKSGEPIRLIGITGSNLTVHEQPILFDEGKKKKDLYQTVDAIRHRFGSHMITKAKLLPSHED